MESTFTTDKQAHANPGRHPIFTDDHEAMRLEIRRFVESELTPHAVEWEETTFPDSVFKRMGELGFLGLAYPEEYGGQGGDYAYSVVMAEEMARSTSGGLNMAVAVQTDMANPPIKKFGTHEQKMQYLKPALLGEKIACLGITEPGAGSDVAGIQTTAVRDGSDWVINGSKVFITNGIRADYIVMIARTDPDAGYAGFSLFIVDMDLPGVVREKKLEKMGMHASDTALLSFTDVRVPADAILGEEGKGFYNIMWELQGERLFGGISAVAGAQLAIEQTLQYAKDRKAFGQSIANFQGIRWKFAQMSTELEAARQLNYNTAHRILRGDYPVKEITMAKLFASQISFKVMDECLQIHGGAGYMKEYMIERAWRDARLVRIGAGSDETMLEYIGAMMGI